MLPPMVPRMAVAQVTANPSAMPATSIVRILRARSMFLPAFLSIMPGLARLIHPFRRDLPNVQGPADWLKTERGNRPAGLGEGTYETARVCRGAVATVILARASRAQPVKMPRVRSMN
jgi:hypothetical protein